MNELWTVVTVMSEVIEMVVPAGGDMDTIVPSGFV